MNGLQAQTSQTTHPGSDLPDVIFILSDDQAWNDYSFMGHPHIRTPALDRLAQESQLFTRGYVPDSLCRPSLATIIRRTLPASGMGLRRSAPDTQR
ncbi:MAG: sulfatase-like hydrolase/transferase [Pirellulaceae bacterium]